ncbi:MAG TPA: hypothetical protein VMT12_12195 [Syntrophales bacterium]|nr:hypothetical protein [Syntrophales bacterium]
MKSILMKSFALLLLIVAGICLLASCYRFSSATLSGSLQVTAETYYNPISGKNEFKTYVLSGKEITLLQYNETLIQQDKELREACAQKCNTAYQHCADQRQKLQNEELLLGIKPVIRPFRCDEAATVLQNCIIDRHNIMLPNTVQKAVADTKGVYVFPDKVSYGKYLLFAEWGPQWWAVPVVINQGQTNVDLTEKNVFRLPLINRFVSSY